jgi:hypothetical protein
MGQVAAPAGLARTNNVRAGEDRPRSRLKKGEQLPQLPIFAASSLCLRTLADAARRRRHGVVPPPTHWDVWPPYKFSQELNYDLAQPFLPWLDPMYYMLAPNGGFESGFDAWTLSSGAVVVNGNETYQVGGPGHSHSLLLPSSSSATTSSMCVGILDPTVRLFAVNEGSRLSELKVEVLYIDAFGNPRAATVALLSGTRTWRPTLPLPFRAQLANPPLLTDGTTSIAFRFSPSGVNARWRIDDVYVDPFKGR